MRRVLILAVFLALAHSILAAQSATLAPGTITEVVGGTAWTNPNNMIADDAATADVSAINPRKIQATNFGFTLGPTYVIDSITARIDCYGADVAASPQTFYLLKAGTATGTNNGSWVNWTTGVMATYSLSGTLWGTTWTATEINATNFGLEFDLGSDDVYAYSVDYLQITVYYHVPTDNQRSATGGVGYSGGGFIF